jgi:hypothetical protein
MAKIEIKISRFLLRVAVEDAAMYAGRAELKRQIEEQIKGTRLYGANVTVEAFPFHIDKMILDELPEICDIKLTWVD